MCSVAFIDQNRLLPSFEPSIESSSSLYVPYGDLEKEEFLDSPFFSPLRATIPPSLTSFPEGEDKEGCESFASAALVQKNDIQSSPSSVSIVREKKRAEESFQFHREYIKKRLREDASESVSTRQLFEEIKANGYLGAYSTVITFLSTLRKKKGAEASLQFHREYIKKRMEEDASEPVSTRQLFEEITAKGYQGTLRTLQTFVSMTRISKAPEASLEFHKKYLKKRIEAAGSKFVSAKQLFEEITAKGYQGKLRTVQTFVSTIRTVKVPEASLEFHKGYIEKRIEQAASKSVSIKQLFKEIRASGYLGSYDTLRKSIPTIREKKNKRAEASFQFHKKYVSKRLGQAAPESVSIKQLFEEIKINGYLGAYNTVRAFVSTIRDKKNKRPETSLAFHKEYIKKKLEQAASESVSVKELFGEIKAKGYQGTLSTVQTFASMIRTSRAPEASLEFHKEYIRKRLEQAASESVSSRQLFEAIRANGYLGVYSTVAAFVSTVRTSSPIETSLQFHKEYIRKRIEQAAPESVSIRQLFKEIKASGYLGSYNTVAAFVSKIRTNSAPEA